MDIGSLGSYRLHESFLDTSSPGIAGPRSPVNEKTDFSAYLEKARTLEAKALETKALETMTPEAGTPDTARGPEGGKTVIDRTSKLYELCESLETFLLKNLVNGMRNTVQKSGLVDGGFAGKMYEDMLYDEYTKVFAKNANFGLAELAYLELTHQRGKLIARNEETL